LAVGFGGVCFTKGFLWWRGPVDFRLLVDPPLLGDPITSMFLFTSPPSFSTPSSYAASNRFDPFSFEALITSFARAREAAVLSSLLARRRSVPRDPTRASESFCRLSSTSALTRSRACSRVGEECGFR
jgi:hypothetical protein